MNIHKIRCELLEAENQLGMFIITFRDFKEALSPEFMELHKENLDNMEFHIDMTEKRLFFKSYEIQDFLDDIDYDNDDDSLSDDCIEVLPPNNDGSSKNASLSFKLKKTEEEAK